MNRRTEVSEENFSDNGTPAVLQYSGRSEIIFGSWVLYRKSQKYFIKIILTNNTKSCIINYAMRNCVRVARQTLTLFVWVQILVPQPNRELSLAFRFNSFSLSGFPFRFVLSVQRIAYLRGSKGLWAVRSVFSRFSGGNGDFYE